MFSIIIRNPLNYNLIYEGQFKTLKEIVSNLKKEFPHNTFFTFYKLKYLLYNGSKVDFIEVKNLNPHKKHKDKF